MADYSSPTALRSKGIVVALADAFYEAAINKGTGQRSSTS